MPAGLIVRNGATQEKSSVKAPNQTFVEKSSQGTAADNTPEGIVEGAAKDAGLSPAPAPAPEQNEIPMERPSEGAGGDSSGGLFEGFWDSLGF